MVGKEPRWRVVLCWGSVIAYLTTPWIVFVFHVCGWLDRALVTHELSYLRLFYFSNTTLLVSLAGLNTFSHWKGNGNGRKSLLGRPNT